MRTLGLVVNVGNGYGSRKERRLQELQSHLRRFGAAVHVFRTGAPGLAGSVLRAALAGNCEALLTAGGDGTFNDLLQAVAGNGYDIPIGVLPFGSGNILAQDLGTSSDMQRLASDLLRAEVRPVAVGRMRARESSSVVERYFGVAAGVGADARVICGVDARLKARIGIAAYYAEAMRQLLFSREPFPEFMIEFTDSQTGQKRSERVTQAVAERVTYFGRCLAGHNGHGLHTREFRLVLFKTNRRSVFVGYGARMVASKFSRRSQPMRDVEIAHARQVLFLPVDDSRAPVLAEVDGEPLGHLPAEIEIADRPIRLLVARADEAGSSR
ncbi:MAG: diacylglycerol/lipid kinase family protein [Terriglobales bacterium]